MTDTKMRPEWGAARVYGDSRIGKDTYLGDHVIVGHPGKNEKDLLVGGRSAESRGATVGAGCVLRAHGILYAGARLGDRVQTGHDWLVREDTTVGDGTLIGSGTIVDDRCTIGARVSIQSAVYIPTFTTIGDDAFLGPRVCLTNDKYMARGEVVLEGVTIGDGARLGANCTVLPGVTIGADAVVGAGAVVTRDVPPAKIVAGVPARVVSEVPRAHRLPRLVETADEGAGEDA